jgi:PAS domain S-box-containing protein
VLAAGSPGVALALVLLWINSYSLDHKLEGTVGLLVLWFGLSISARDLVVNSIRVLSNVVSALEEEDFSFRATRAIQGDALGDLALDINNLADALETERIGTLETTNLLRKVMAEAGAVIFAFSPDGKIRLINRAGETFLGKNKEQIMNRTAEELEIDDLLQGPSSETISRSISDVERRWIVRRTYFRQHGVRHRLVVLSEASEALRAEENSAWQKIIRVLSHEINNSLAPIKSIARSLARMSSGVALSPDLSENLTHGLEVISNRAESLNRFLQNYTKLAKLPPPTRQVARLDALTSLVINLDPRLRVNVLSGPDVNIYVDQDQLEQALINLVRNAVDAVLLKTATEFGPDAVTLSWKTTGRDLELWIRDQGIGLVKTDNLFVPFYTTKETGSGIGLLLSRQIIEAHNGTLMIRNRTDYSGCEVEIRLPGCIVDDPDNPGVDEGLP